jgi:diaminopimelate decarboxylase
MNDLMRPALYDAFHAIQAVQLDASISQQTFEVVGPVCESGDFLGHARELAVQAGSLLAIMSAGAYGMSMSSNYNTRPRAAEVMVDGATVHLIREREKVAQLFAGEKVIG